ncbi:MAG: hypothetical protein J7598_18260 [Mitsuaria chitosanitabida]|jgi:hypothetical protein|nr:hypothetical protein [Roseateles chitosanitabidus]MBO9688549.1 hypothetical protein [Roseateles chitosanitabidus]
MHRDLILTTFLATIVLASMNVGEPRRFMLGGIVALAVLRWVLDRWKD